jgi:hypothetical protein
MAGCAIINVLHVYNDKEIVAFLIKKADNLPNTMKNAVCKHLTDFMMGKTIVIDDRFGKVFVDEQNAAIKWIENAALEF